MEIYLSKEIEKSPLIPYRSSRMRKGKSMDEKEMTQKTTHKKKKKRRGRRKNSPVWRWLLIVAAIIVIVLAIVLIYRNNAGRKKTDVASFSGNAVEQENTGLTFPYELEDGKLSIESIFQFTGFNPDNGNQEGENIAALTVLNQSEQHLVSAEITVKLADNTELTFELTDVPAGQSVMVFEKENKIYELNDTCEDIKDTAEFETENVRMEDSFSIDVQGTAVTLTNNSEGDISNLLLHCHCLIGDSYFGGLTYTYPVESIPAGQSVTVEADDCYLGEAAVVRISQDNGEE